LALLGEKYAFKNYFDHQYPYLGKYGSADKSLSMMREFLEAKKKEGLHCEKFRPGALNQIRLVNDKDGCYRNSFSIRNVCANGVCWTGKGEDCVDYAAIHVKATGKEVKINQNLLSMGFVVQYGKFRYWAGGDVSGFLKDADGRPFNYEAVVGKSVGPVTVCKTNHHAWKDAMVKEFVEEVKAEEVSEEEAAKPAPKKTTRKAPAKKVEVTEEVKAEETPAEEPVKPAAKKTIRKTAAKKAPAKKVEVVEEVKAEEAVAEAPAKKPVARKTAVKKASAKKAVAKK
jgi:hypothetical protein